jgi:predicted DNA-binding protein YlxM (UPF0122 family)
MYEKNFKRDPGNQDLLDKITYASVSQLKNIIKYLNVFDSSENFKDLCVLADIKTALGLYDKDEDNRVLTPKQKVAITGHLIEDKPQSQVAEEMGISQQAVSLLINTGLKRIQQFLTNTEIKKIHWTDEEKDFLLTQYPILGPEKTAEKLNKPKSKTISMYHVLVNAKRQKDEN